MFPIAAKLQSVANALTILELLADRDELGLVEIAEALGVVPSTAHRLLMTLLEMGFVVRDPASKRYKIALKVFQLGVSSIKQTGLSPLAFTQMRALSALTNETVSLGVPTGVEIMYVERIEARHTLKSEYPLGYCAPIHCTALGKAYLAALPADERTALLERLPLLPKTPHTVVDRARLEEAITSAISLGYAIDDREIDENLRCVAAAILDRTHRPVAAISVAGPAFRIEAETLHEWGAAVHRSATEVSRALGWTG